MALRRSVPVRSRTRWPGGVGDLCGDGRLVRPAQHPDRHAILHQRARQRRHNGRRPGLAFADRTGRQRNDGRVVVGQALPRAPGSTSCAGTFNSGSGHSFGKAAFAARPARPSDRSCAAARARRCAVVDAGRSALRRRNRCALGCRPARAPAPPSICATSPAPGRNGPRARRAASCRCCAKPSRRRGRSATIAGPQARHVVGQAARRGCWRPCPPARPGAASATASPPNGRARNRRSRHRGRSGPARGCSSWLMGPRLRDSGPGRRQPGGLSGHDIYPFPSHFAVSPGPICARARTGAKDSQTARGRAMFLVTGGAGFIGSNVVASLNEAGATDIVVNDALGHDDAKWRNLAKHQDRRPGAAGRTDGLARRPQARRRHPHGRDFRHHRHRRRPGDGEQFPPVAAPARLVHADPHAVHLRLLGRHLWRRQPGLRRRLVAGGLAPACSR